MLCYCKKCGRIVYFVFDEDEKICDFCKSNVSPIPEEFLSSPFSIKENLKKQFIDEYIKSSPEFDQNMFNKREEYSKQHSHDFEKYNAALEHGKAVLEGRDKENQFGVECPYCYATNVKKISTTSRVVSVGLFSLGSKKIGKQWHCNKCDSDF